MGHTRAIIKGVELSLATAAMYALLALGLLALSASRGTARKWRAYVFRRWARAAAAIINLKISVSGLAPEPPFLLVCNHLSYVDVLVLASKLDCVFVARGDVAGWPVIGSLCRAVATIFVNREKRRDVARVNDLIDVALKQGRGVVLFAEGTSTIGSTVGEFKSSLLEQAARASFPVSYASLGYTTPGGGAPPHLSVCWWGEMTFLPHVYELLRLREIGATVRFGRNTIQRGNRKDLAEELCCAVKAQFTPVVATEQKCGSATR